MPVLAADTLRPAGNVVNNNHHEPLLNVKAVETGVIDVSALHPMYLGTRLGAEIRRRGIESVLSTEFVMCRSG